MRVLMTGLAALMLAGCSADITVNDGDEPNESVVESQLESDQMNEAIAIDNDAAADNENADTD